MQITITEALSKLKTLNARIQKEITSTQFITVSTGGKLKAQFQSREDFESNVTAKYKSIKDLIEYRSKLKSAIVSSNAATDVVVGGKTFKVAEAIEFKSSIALDQQLLVTITNQFDRVQREVEQANRQAQDRLDKLLEQTFGKDVKVDPDNIKSMTEGFMSKNESKLVDPLNLQDVSEKLNINIQDFLSNVDVALSISNSTTFIEI